MNLRDVYAELCALVGRRRCPVEDWHRSRWRIVRDDKNRLQLEPVTPEPEPADPEIARYQAGVERARRRARGVSPMPRK